MSLEGLAGWVAPAATMIAAMMTAANLGARVTGWGFAVFVIGSIAWCLVGITTGQDNLLITNGFLVIVNLIGVWRWLGREARYNQNAIDIADASESSPAPTLVPAGTLIGQKLHDAHGAVIGEVVEAMLTCPDGGLASLMIRQGGIGGVGESVRVVQASAIAIEVNDASLRITLGGARAMQ